MLNNKFSVKRKEEEGVKMKGTFLFATIGLLATILNFTEFIRGDKILLIINSLVITLCVLSVIILEIQERKKQKKGHRKLKELK